MHPNGPLPVARLPLHPESQQFSQHAADLHPRSAHRSFLASACVSMCKMPLFGMGHCCMRWLLVIALSAVGTYVPSSGDATTLTFEEFASSPYSSGYVPNDYAGDLFYTNLAWLH